MGVHKGCHCLMQPSWLPHPMEICEGTGADMALGP